MKQLLIALLVVAVSCQSVHSYGCIPSQECSDYKYNLAQINKLLNDESYYHRFNLYNYGGNTVLSRTQYILNALNDKITSYQTTKSRGSSGYGIDSNGCKQLEDEILAKSKEFGIEKIGLEDNLSRLRKVFNHQDERNRFNGATIDENINKTQTCLQSNAELENANESLNSKNIEHAKNIKQKDEQIKLLQKEIHRLRAKQNANSPAIHGGTGKVYPEVTNSIAMSEAGGPAITSTTELTVNPVSSNVTATEAEEDEATTNPNIDLRNNAENGS